MSASNKANQRQGKKHKAKYQAQVGRTQRNKKRNLLRQIKRAEAKGSVDIGALTQLAVLKSQGKA